MHPKGSTTGNSSAGSPQPPPSINFESFLSRWEGCFLPIWRGKKKNPPLNPKFNHPPDNPTLGRQIYAQHHHRSLRWCKTKRESCWSRQKPLSHPSEKPPAKGTNLLGTSILLDTDLCSASAGPGPAAAGRAGGWSAAGCTSCTLQHACEPCSGSSTFTLSLRGLCCSTRPAHSCPL